MKECIEDLISEYDARIKGFEILFDTTQQFIEGFQNSFFEKKEERKKINLELRESLAKNNSLRKKDYDRMTSSIISMQNKKENEVKRLLTRYLNERKELARTLRENLEEFKNALVEGELQRVKEHQKFIWDIISELEEGKKKITTKLKEFQKEEHEMANELKKLLAKGKEVRIKDLQLMLTEFHEKHKERQADNEKRKESIHTMLNNFKNERRKTAKNQ
jgi:hypothetical protein